MNSLIFYTIFYLFSNQVYCLSFPSIPNFLSSINFPSLDNVPIIRNICLRSCCGEYNFNTNLQKNLAERLHGQPLVYVNVADAVYAHAKAKHPSKALVLSFHGWTGSGKNYASQIIAENMFTRGMKSTGVKLFIATVDFTNPSKIEEYKETLLSTIKQQLKSCSRALFIFDEMDKMPISLLDVIKPFLEHYHDVGGVDSRHSTFIFLSNSAGKLINEIAYDDWLNNRPREQISLSKIQAKLSSAAYNEIKGGLWHSYLIESHVITAFVPFLPLQLEHVILCIRDEARRSGVKLTSDEENTIAKELTYWPSDTKVYSQSGCKRIPELVKIQAHLTQKSNYKSEL